EQTDALLMARRLDDIEAHAVVGDVEDPIFLRALPGHPDRARLSMLAHVLKRLLHDPVHRELLKRGEMGIHGVESAADADAAAGLPLSRVVAHRLSEAELGELGRAKVVDHPADRVERGAELALE